MILGAPLRHHQSGHIDNLGIIFNKAYKYHRELALVISCILFIRKLGDFARMDENTEDRKGKECSKLRRKDGILKDYYSFL